MALYEPLPEGSVRLLRLLPCSDQHSEIRCKVFMCPVLTSGSTHLYDALSYVWGPEDNNQPSIYIDDYKMPVRANLHAALLHLRDHFIERIIWIDAICINQEDDDEKGQQVQSMAEIYAKATRVIVWLGEVADKSDCALEAIRAAAQEEYAVERQNTGTAADETNLEAIAALLERPWFQRIWVLQEAAAARHILVRCGNTEIDGYAFCSGLRAQGQPQSYSVLRSPSIAYLMRDAIFRPRYQGSRENWPDRFSLNIRPLGELVDIYHTRKATDRRDKVYALIGMSSDDPGAAGLSANYNTSWKELFQKLIKYCLSPRVSVSAWDDIEAAAIRGKGCILGEVWASQTQHDEQHVSIAWRNPPDHFVIDWEEKQSSQLTFQASAKPIEVGDVVCFLRGATNATIIRSCNDLWTVIAITVPSAIGLHKWLASITAFPHNLLLVWDWEVSQGKGDYECLMSSRIPGYVGTDCQVQESMDGATRLWNHGLLLNTLGRYKEARWKLGKAVRIYGTGTALESVSKPDLSHGPYTEEDERTIRIMNHLYINDKAELIESEYEQDSLTPLAWAVVEGDEELVGYLLDMDADVHSLAVPYNQLLLWAATANQKGIMKLLISKGADKNRVALSVAAESGHEAVVRFLLDEGVDIDSRDDLGHVPLTLAAKHGQKEVVRCLLDRGANIESTWLDLGTPLMLAVVALGSLNAESSDDAKILGLDTANKFKATIELLLDRGANIETEDREGCRPLWVAAVNGNEAIVKLLLDRGANIELKDNDGRTVLWEASEGGNEAMVKLLLDRGAEYRLKNGSLYGFGFR